MHVFSSKFIVQICASVVLLKYGASTMFRCFSLYTNLQISTLYSIYKYTNLEKFRCQKLHRLQPICKRLPPTKIRKHESIQNNLNVSRKLKGNTVWTCEGGGEVSMVYWWSSHLSQNMAVCQE
jgi:hypothetical protein